MSAQEGCVIIVSFMHASYFTTLYLLILNITDLGMHIST